MLKKKVFFFLKKNARIVVYVQSKKKNFFFFKREDEKKKVREKKRMKKRWERIDKGRETVHARLIIPPAPFFIHTYILWIKTCAHSLLLLRVVSPSIFLPNSLRDEEAKWKRGRKKEKKKKMMMMTIEARRSEMKIEEWEIECSRWWTRKDDVHTHMQRKTARRVREALCMLKSEMKLYRVHVLWYEPRAARQYMKREGGDTAWCRHSLARAHATVVRPLTVPHSRGAKHFQSAKSSQGVKIIPAPAFSTNLLTKTLKFTPRFATFLPFFFFFFPFFYSFFFF